ncbi:hypothetical protein [Spongorhabdus nitratireducens]
MIEIIGIIGSIFGIIAFFAIAPRDVKNNVKAWFVEPIQKVNRDKNAISLNECFQILSVDDIRIENSFIEKPLNYKRFDSEIISYNCRLPDQIEHLKSNEIKERQEDASKRGITLDNNASFALRRIDVSRPEGKNGKRENNYKLILEPTKYFDFVFPNLCLEKRFYNEDTQEKHTLRELLSLDKRKLSISSLEDFPFCQFKVGTGTLVITSDNYVICSVRSRRQLVARKQKQNELYIHLSAAEGMYRSELKHESSDCFEDQVITPFATASRSLLDEINIDKDLYNIEKIECQGYFFDLKRAQPFFLFSLNLEMTSEEFFEHYSNTSVDIHENDAIFAIPVNLKNIKYLFDNASFNILDAKYPQIYNDYFSINSSSQVKLASNHAQTGYAMLAYKECRPTTQEILQTSYNK